MSRYLIFTDDNEENEYRFYLPEGPAIEDQRNTSYTYEGDEWDEAVAIFYDMFGTELSFGGCLVASAAVTPAEQPDALILQQAMQSHYKGFLNYSRYPYKVTPTAGVSFYCDNAVEYPYDTFLHLKGSDPETRRYIKFFDYGNSNCQVYDSTKTAPMQYYEWSAMGWDEMNVEKRYISDFDAFKNASENDAGNYMYMAQIHRFDASATDLVLQYAVYWVRAIHSRNGFGALWYILQSGADVHEETDDKDPYEGDDAPYDPSEPGGGDGDGVDPYDDGDPIPYPDDPDYSVGDTGLLEIYIPSEAQLNLLAGYLWSSNFVDSMVKSVYADPMDVIISVGALPFAIPSAGSKHIKVGDRDSGVNSFYPSSGYYNFDCGTVKIKSVVGSYLDYAPYTKGHIYIPYVGFVPLDIDTVMNKTIGLKYKVDISNGSAIAFLLVNGKVMQSFSCNLMLPIPLSSANYSAMWGSVLSATATLAGAGIASEAAIGGAATAATAASKKSKKNEFTQSAEAASSITNSMATKPTIQKSNNIGVSTGLLAVKYPYIILERPNACLPAKQNQIMGYPSYISAQLSTLSGYTRVSEMNLAAPSATARELDEIESYLKSGVIIGSGDLPSNQGITLFRNKSPENQIKKNLELVQNLTGTFRDQVDVHNPVFRIEYANPADFNYVYISSFGRCYHVQSVDVVRNGILDVHCTCDVLNSFANEILANEAIIDKQETKYNLYLNDDSLKVYQNPLISTWKFPNALGASHTYVLLVAGD